jgi:3-oxoacyl-[acyl-carrier-protein] synthase II
VCGLGIISVFGTSHEAFRDALLEGRSGIAPIAGFDTTRCRTTIAAELKGFQPTDWVPAMKLRRLDRTGVYAIGAAKLALANAQTTIDAAGDDRLGVVLGTWTAGGQSTQIFLEALFKSGPTGAPALLFDSTVGNSAASLAALELKLRGPNVTVSHKEASGLHALATAVDLLRENRASALLAGGVDAIFETFFKAHDRFAVMSPAAEFSARLSPFDAERSGFVMGEGGFAFWLEAAVGRDRDLSAVALAEAEAAPPRPPLGEILGVSMSSAAVPVNAWPDRPEPLARSMRLAIEDAGLTPADVHVVYASANATSLDAVEAAALRDVFAGSQPVVTAIKGAIGESGASGTAACAAALLCGAVGRVPPIAGLAHPAAEAAGLRLAREAMAAPGPIALINSFASGGALASIVVRANRV